MAKPIEKLMSVPEAVRQFVNDGDHLTGKDVVTVPAANPDVCIVHVQRADKFGIAQYWGAIGSVPAAALASKRIIKKYTLNELLIIAAAREIHNYDNVILGVKTSPGI